MAIMCILTAIMQAGGFLNLDHTTQVMITFLPYIPLLIFLLILAANKKLNARTGVLFLMAFGTLIRCGYVLLSSLYDRQHDAGVYTGIATDYINPGHIGYIEYIYKFGTLPQVNPYELFGYYHPPLHHIISTLWLKLNLLLGASEDMAFENLQILPLFYSCLLMFVTYRILKTLEADEKGMLIGMCLIIFHPATIVMGGSVNNDMLTILFMALIILYTLKFIRQKNLKNLLILALCIGFGMITKLNAGVLAFPVALIFLIHFIGIIKSKVPDNIKLWLKNYVLFAIVVLPIGLSWIVRNELKYSEHPGVPVPGPTSELYTKTYSLWARLGIPSIAQWHFDFPFHPFKASACCNTWAIMFHTALFAEEYPADMNDSMLIFCRITFILALILALAVLVLLFRSLLDKRTSSEDRIFLLVGYVTIIISFIAFVIIYPYTCSADFRYITICLVYSSVALALGNKYKYRFIRYFNYLTVACMGMITLIYMFWNRW